jgi:queuine tRNA-ribosyltransferase
MINIKNNKWKDDFSPIDPHSTSAASRIHTKAYLRHLIYCKEYLGAQIASLHNLCFFLWLVKQARQHIAQGNFKSWKTGMVQSMSRRL